MNDTHIAHSFCQDYKITMLLVCYEKKMLIFNKIRTTLQLLVNNYLEINHYNFYRKNHLIIKCLITTMIERNLLESQ